MVARSRNMHGIILNQNEFDVNSLLDIENTLRNGNENGVTLSMDEFAEDVLIDIENAIESFLGNGVPMCIIRTAGGTDTVSQTYGNTLGRSHPSTFMLIDEYVLTDANGELCGVDAAPHILNALFGDLYNCYYRTKVYDA